MLPKFYGAALLLCGSVSLFAQNSPSDPAKETVLKQAAAIFCDCEYTSKFALLMIAKKYNYLSDEEFVEPFQLLQEQGRVCVGDMQTKLEELEDGTSPEDEAFLLNEAKKLCPKTLEYTDVANGSGVPLPESAKQKLNLKQATNEFCSCQSLKSLQNENEKRLKASDLDKIELAISMAAMRVQVASELGKLRYTLGTMGDAEREEFQTKLEKKIQKKCPKLQDVYNLGQ